MGRHNIILFGAPGVGKSSIVNMLLGREVAQFSSGARACTLDSKGYDFNANGRQFRIHDTVGLSQGEAARDPKKDDLFKLYSLLYGLSDGVSLLVFCVRAPRIGENAKYNWTLFYDIICRKKVPILVVVTGLEAEEDMDAWCDRKENWEAIRQEGIHPNAITGITATKGKRNVYEVEYAESEEKLKNLIEKHHLLTPWKVERVEWMRDIYKTKYEWWDCFKGHPRQVVVGQAREAAQRLISECGMSPDDADKLVEELERI